MIKFSSGSGYIAVQGLLLLAFTISNNLTYKSKFPKWYFIHSISRWFPTFYNNDTTFSRVLMNGSVKF